MPDRQEDRSWWIFRGTYQKPQDDEVSPFVVSQLNRKDAPPWRRFDHLSAEERGAKFRPEAHEIERVNAALMLRRPLLVTGKPGTGKTTLAYAVAYELGLGEVLRWSITSRTTLQDGLYHYDAIARLQDSQQTDYEQDISHYLKLGPLGTAFLGRKYQGEYYPRVLLIDEIDKSDIDLPNDLLHIFEEGEFEITELKRLSRLHHKHQQEDTRKKTIDCWDGSSTEVIDGKVKCEAFPLVVMTSNGEREFPPAFLRRCLQLEIRQPSEERLRDIVEAHLRLEEKIKPGSRDIYERLLKEFLTRRDTKKQDLSTDQLLNAVYLILRQIDPDQGVRPPEDKDSLRNALLKSLSGLEGLEQ